LDTIDSSRLLVKKGGGLNDERRETGPHQASLATIHRKRPRKRWMAAFVRGRSGSGRKKSKKKASRSPMLIRQQPSGASLPKEGENSISSIPRGTGQPGSWSRALEKRIKSGVPADRFIRKAVQSQPLLAKGYVRTVKGRGNPDLLLSTGNKK